MKQVKIITAQEAAQLVKDGDVVTTNGFVGSGQPEALTSALEERFLNTGSPRRFDAHLCRFPGEYGMAAAATTSPTKGC